MKECKIENKEVDNPEENKKFNKQNSKNINNNKVNSEPNNNDYIQNMIADNYEPHNFTHGKSNRFKNNNRGINRYYNENDVFDLVTKQITPKIDKEFSVFSKNNREFKIKLNTNNENNGKHYNKNYSNNNPEKNSYN